MTSSSTPLLRTTFLHVSGVVSVLTCVVGRGNDVRERRGWAQVEREQVEASVNSSVREWASSSPSGGTSSRARQTTPKLSYRSCSTDQVCFFSCAFLDADFRRAGQRTKLTLKAQITAEHQQGREDAQQQCMWQSACVVRAGCLACLLSL